MMEKSIEDRAYEKFMYDYNRSIGTHNAPDYVRKIVMAAMTWKTTNIRPKMGTDEGGQEWKAYPLLHVCKTIIYSGEFDIMEIMEGQIETPQISESNITGEQPGFESDKPF